MKVHIPATTKIILVTVCGASAVALGIGLMRPREKNYTTSETHKEIASAVNQEFVVIFRNPIRTQGMCAGHF
jgi:hypothetical protein